MKKQKLIKAIIVIGLGAQIFGLTPSFLNQCYAQDLEKGSKPAAVAPKTPAWVPLGGELQRGLSVLAYDNGEINVFGVGTDDALWTIDSKDKGKTWGSFTRHKSDISLGSAPACAKESESVATFVCYFKKGGQLYRIVTEKGSDHGYAGKYGYGKFLTSDPDVVFNGNGANYNVFAGAEDNALWYAPTGPGQGSGNYWKSMGGALKGRPSCVARMGAFGKPIAVPYSFITCYVVGTDDAVWVEKAGEWTRVGGQAIGGVNAFVQNPFGQPILAVRGTDSTLWLGHEVGKKGEWEWKNYPGEISSVPACKANYCFAILPDGQLGFLDLTGLL